ncbi:superoxide dismutase [Mycobacterium sp. CBMA293]|uniref:superoxide dismutase[Cu-Zn] n=1 Tax=unclassified Mycolicibacterium TaxID=2636767 RepID=UPI0012DDB021|nr:MULTISPECIES: superoxide dismutase family protein [unclassified Mycolicibacterium]MUL44511.1 superoxide dismutase [Mycolicibacterium sp. CBMA 360]MUL59831.1 superoxide dismutase [Mycolicibacterium sp. CBMA 335]MUL68674.1 superoxide dismutase [Mycolicibacterium sp. CBMA 311]MUL93935.1 superoxide dismutase [Mycolicibacterium sp. CBMA 230]MUM06181.1 superoxide dismutase [Mycolicibacterium sp. CBMA 213]
MPISAPIRFLAAAAVIAPVVAACAPPGQVATSQPGTPPAVWTGVEHAPQAQGEKAEAPKAAPIGEKLVTELKTPEGVTVATAEFLFNGGFATLTVKTTEPGVLAPGFHGLHIHSTGKCEPNSAAPAGGAPGDFLSAGGHFQVPGHTAHPMSGDLASLQVRSDGSAQLVTTTDAFTAEQLLAGNKTALIIHEKADNFGNIPADRYQQIQGAAPGADEASMNTGDAGKRVACGVISAG